MSWLLGKIRAWDRRRIYRKHLRWLRASRVHSPDYRSSLERFYRENGGARR